MDSSKVEVRTTKKYGKGVFAIEKIRKGEIIAEFDGQIYDYDYEFWNEDLSNHCIQFDDTHW